MGALPPPTGETSRRAERRHAHPRGQARPVRRGCGQGDLLLPTGKTGRRAEPGTRNPRRGRRVPFCRACGAACGPHLRAELLQRGLVALHLLQRALQPHVARARLLLGRPALLLQPARDDGGPRTLQPPRHASKQRTHPLGHLISAQATAMCNVLRRRLAGALSARCVCKGFASLSLQGPVLQFRFHTLVAAPERLLGRLLGRRLAGHQRRLRLARLAPQSLHLARRMAKRPRWVAQGARPRPHRHARRGAQRWEGVRVAWGAPGACVCFRRCLSAPQASVDVPPCQGSPAPCTPDSPCRPMPPAA